MRVFSSLGWMAAIALVAFIGMPAMAADASGDPYTLSTCPISGKELGDEPVVKVVDGREIRFCCEGCPSKFEAEPAKYLSKIDAEMIEAQEAAYPLETCPVMEEEAIGDDAINVVYKNRLVKFCCKSCAKHLEDEGDVILEKLNAAAKEKQGESYALKTCPVSGEELGSMGEPTELVIANRLVKFCCKGCEKTAIKNPAMVLSKVDEAEKAGG